MFSCAQNQQQRSLKRNLTKSAAVVIFTMTDFGEVYSGIWSSARNESKGEHWQEIKEMNRVLLLMELLVATRVRQTDNRG